MLKELASKSEPMSEFERTLMLECIGDCITGYTETGSPIINNHGILMLMQVIHMSKNKFDILTWLVKNNLTGHNLLKFLSNEREDVGEWFHKLSIASKDRICFSNNSKIN